MTAESMRIGGYAIDFHACGPADAPQVVFVHGMMESVDVWHPLVQQLSARYRCIALAMPWNGQQDGLWGSVLAPEQWLAEGVRRFGIQPDAWIAHSFGASTLVSLLAKDRTFPGAAAPASLLSPFYAPSRRGVTWHLLKRYIDEFPAFVEQSILARTSRTLSPDVLARMTRAACESFGSHAWIEFWRLFSSMPFLSLHPIRQQALVITGADDLCSRLSDVTKLATDLPAATLDVVQDAGHFLISSRRQAIVEKIERFLAAHCPTPSGPCATRGSGTEPSHFMEVTL